MTTDHCVVCKMKREHPEGKCFIVDITEVTCINHRHIGQYIKPVKDYLALNTWAGNLGEGTHFYKITG